MPPRATIIVCTYNRAAIVRETIQALAALTTPPDNVEVLVVDNASTDGTLAACEEACAHLPMAARCLSEPTPGVSHARNRGIREAAGEIIVFLDDDAVCEPGWLDALLDVYASHPDAECVGGRIDLDWKTPPPPWWRPSMDHHLSALDLGPQVRRLSYPDYPYGANMSFHRRVFARGLGFDTGLGRKGRLMAGGAETAMCMAVEWSGGALYYAPRAIVHHRADGSRANAAYLIRKSFQHGRSRARLEAAFLDLDPRLRKAVNFAMQALTIALTGGRSVESACEWRYRAGYVWESLARAFR